MPLLLSLLVMSILDIQAYFLIENINSILLIFILNLFF